MLNAPYPVAAYGLSEQGAEFAGAVVQPRKQSAVEQADAGESECVVAVGSQPSVRGKVEIAGWMVFGVPGEHQQGVTIRIGRDFQ